MRERHAYAAVEEARLWCEVVLERPQTDAARRLVTALHHEIGVAGLHASDHLRPERRRAMLALAHARTHERVRRAHASATIEPLESLIDRAVAQVRQALGVEGLCDEMAEAHQRLLAARELLVAARSNGRRLTLHE